MILFTTLITISLAGTLRKPAPETGSVIFIHPDGSGAPMWYALRLLDAGPDGYLNWDKLEKIGAYRGHLWNSVSSSSNGGGTVHAYSKKADYYSYGLSATAPTESASGQPYSIMTEAQENGLAVGLINSGHICEPGSGVFLASAESRKLTDTIAHQIVHSGAEVLFSGGEKYLLPEGVMGFHGQAGVRRDGRNLLDEARNLGYSVIMTREELLNLPDDTERVLGIFAAVHTFTGLGEDILTARGLPLYFDNTPTLAEMTDAALRILERSGKNFMLVVEEEGSDNFANWNNAAGAIEAVRRADAAIGVALDFIDDNPRTTLITAADSYAGGMGIRGLRADSLFTKTLPACAENGAPIDGPDGTGSLPFVSAPDQFGNRLRFLITWADHHDLEGGVIAKAHGLNSIYLPNNVDNTDIYRLMYLTLFGVELPN